METQEILQALKVAAQKGDVKTYPNSAAMVWNALTKRMERYHARKKLDAYYAFTMEHAEEAVKSMTGKGVQV